MDLQQLRYVVEIAETGSFTRAAGRCHVTQSALSHQVAALERELGHKLFVRTSRSVRLTEAGEAFVIRARTSVNAADAAREDAAAVGGRVTGTLRLGVIPTVTAVDLPRTIARFRAKHAHARVELTVGNSDTLTAAVRDGGIDVALLGLRTGAEPEGVAARSLATTRLVACVPHDHKLAARSSIRLADLAGETFADFPSGTSGRAQSDRAFAAAHLARDVAFEADSAELVLGLVAAGLAVGLLAPGVIAASPAAVTAIVVEDGPERVEYLAWERHAPRSIAVAFLDLLGEVGES